MIYWYLNLGFSHVTNYSTALSTVGLGIVYPVSRFLHGFEHPRRRPGQPDRGRPVSGGLFRIPGAVADRARRVV